VYDFVRGCGLQAYQVTTKFNAGDTAQKPLKPLLIIPRVCAQHEHEHTLLKALNKFVKYKF